MLLEGLVAGIVRGWFAGRAEAKAFDKMEPDRWFKLAASISSTAFVSFWGMFAFAGAAALANHAAPLIAIASGLFAGAGAMATSVLILWKRSPLTRGLPITVPMEIEAAALQASTATTIPKDNPQSDSH